MNHDCDIQAIGFLGLVYLVDLNSLYTFVYHYVPSSVFKVSILFQRNRVVQVSGVANTIGTLEQTQLLHPFEHVY